MNKLIEALLKPIIWVGTIIILLLFIIFGVYYGIWGLVIAFKYSWKLTMIGITLISYLISVLCVYDNPKATWPWENLD